MPGGYKLWCIAPESMFASVHIQRKLRAIDGRRPPGFKDSGNDFRCVLTESVACQPGRNDTAVVRPHRSVVILDGIVTGLTFRHGANAPPGKHLGTHEMVPDRQGLVVVHDSAPQ